MYKQWKVIRVFNIIVQADENINNTLLLDIARMRTKLIYCMLNLQCTMM